MKKVKFGITLTAIFFFITTTAMAADICSNTKTVDELYAIKKPLDDPTPILTKTNYFADFVSKETWEKLTHDVDAAKKAWQEVVGFKTPDVVGKVAPEIKPGKYTLADKDKYPFDKLMLPTNYQSFNEPGGQGKNHAFNFTEFEVMPARQLYQHIGVAEASKKNTGQAKLLENGYLDYTTLKPGVPFPKPSGPMAAWQIVYNSIVEFNIPEEDHADYCEYFGINNKFEIDYNGGGFYYFVKLARRVKADPKGDYYDKRAEKQDERMAYYYQATSPRDLYGNAWVNIKYNSPDKPNNFLLYTTMTRRVRKMSSSDQQDQAIGLDASYDDAGLISFEQKLTPDVFPYEIKLVDEREFLVPNYPPTGDHYYDSNEKFVVRNLKLERRMAYVIEMKQLDSTYIYGKRVLYIDKETFAPLMHEMYDQKGRLYRTYQVLYGFSPETGTYAFLGDFQHDYIDVHSTVDVCYSWWAEDIERKEFSPRRLMRQVK